MDSPKQRAIEALERIHEQFPCNCEEDTTCWPCRDIGLIKAALNSQPDHGVPVAWPKVDYTTIPDNESAPIVLAYLRACALSWEPEVRILGNLRSCDVVRVLNELEAAPPQQLDALISAGDAMAVFIRNRSQPLQPPSEVRDWDSAKAAAPRPHREPSPVEVREVFKQWAFDNWEHFKDVEGLKSWTRSGPTDNSNMGRDLLARLTTLFTGERADDAERPA